MSACLLEALSSTPRAPVVTVGTFWTSGDGRQFIDFLHVDDAVRALVDRYARVLGVPIPVQWGARPPRPRETFIPWTAGEVLPGWTPHISLDAGLADLR